MKSTKILLFLIPLLFTACTRPAVIPDGEPETHANETVEADETAGTIPAPENAPTENSADSAAESDEETVPASAIGTDMCNLHISEYHSYPGELIDYIGDEFYDWVYMVESQPDRDLTDECPYSHCNIIECLNYFNISKEEFARLYYTSFYYSCMYDPEIMYSGNNTEIQNFFTDDKTENLELEYKDIILSAKLYLRSSLSDMSVDEQTVEKYYQLPLTAWTFSDIISEAQISRDTFEAFLDEYRSFGDSIDVDAIYHEVEGGVEPVSTDEETLLERCLYNIEHERKFLAAE